MEGTENRGTNFTYVCQDDNDTGDNVNRIRPMPIRTRKTRTSSVIMEHWTEDIKCFKEIYRTHHSNILMIFRYLATIIQEENNTSKPGEMTLSMINPDMKHSGLLEHYFDHLPQNEIWLLFFKALKNTIDKNFELRTYFLKNNGTFQDEKVNQYEVWRNLLLLLVGSMNCDDDPSNHTIQKLFCAGSCRFLRLPMGESCRGLVFQSTQVENKIVCSITQSAEVDRYKLQSQEFKSLFMSLYENVVFMNESLSIQWVYWLTRKIEQYPQSIFFTNLCAITLYYLATYFNDVTMTEICSPDVLGSLTHLPFNVSTDDWLSIFSEKCTPSSERNELMKKCYDFFKYNHHAKSKDFSVLIDWDMLLNTTLSFVKKSKNLRQTVKSDTWNDVEEICQSPLFILRKGFPCKTDCMYVKFADVADYETWKWSTMETNFVFFILMTLELSPDLETLRHKTTMERLTEKDLEHLSDEYRDHIISDDEPQDEGRVPEPENPVIRAEVNRLCEMLKSPPKLDFSHLIPPPRRVPEPEEKMTQKSVIQRPPSPSSLLNKPCDEKITQFENTLFIIYKMFRDGEDLDKIVKIAKEHNERYNKQYPLDVPENFFIFNTKAKFEKDIHSSRLYPKNDSPQNIYPCEIEADGNCLFRSFSLLCFGHEDSHIEMRCRCILELLCNIEFYSSKEMLRDDPRVRENEIAAMCSRIDAYEIVPGLINAIKGSVNVSSWNTVTFWHMASLASVCGIPVRSIYPSSEVGIRKQSKVRMFLNRLIYPRVSQSPASSLNYVLYIMWTHLRQAIRKPWIPNHFSACFPKKEYRDIKEEFDEYGVPLKMLESTENDDPEVDIETVVLDSSSENEEDIFGAKPTFDDSIQTIDSFFDHAQKFSTQNSIQTLESVPISLQIACDEDEVEKDQRQDRENVFQSQDIKPMLRHGIHSDQREASEMIPNLQLTISERDEESEQINKKKYECLEQTFIESVSDQVSSDDEVNDMVNRQTLDYSKTNADFSDTEIDTQSTDFDVNKTITNILQKMKDKSSDRFNDRTMIKSPSPSTPDVSYIDERHNYARKRRTPSPFVTNDSDDSPVIRRFTKGKRKNISEDEENDDVDHHEPCAEKKKCSVTVTDTEASPPIVSGHLPSNNSTYTSTPLKQYLPLPKPHFDKISPIKKRSIKLQDESILEDSAKKLKTVDIDDTLEEESENFMDNSFAYRDMTGDRIREYVKERNKELADEDVLKKTIDALNSALKKEKAMTEQLTNDKSILDDEKRDIERAHMSVKDFLEREINKLKYEKNEQTKTFEVEIKNIKSVLDDMKEKKVKMQQANNTLSTKLADSETTCKTLHDEIAKMREEKTVTSDREKKRVEDQQKINDDLKKEQQLTDNKNKALMDENSGYKMQIQEAVGRLQELNEDLTAKNELISQLKQLNTAGNENCVQILEAHQSNATLIKNMQNQIEKLQEQSENLMQQLSSKHVEIEAMKNKEQLDQANVFAKYAEFEKRIAHLNDDLQQKINATKEASAEKTLIQSELMKEQNKVKMTLEKIHFLQETLNKREEEHSEELKKRNEKINSLIDEHRRQGISRGNEKQLQDRIDEQDKELIAKLQDLDKYRHETYSQERTIEKLKQSFENEKQEKERLQQKMTDMEVRFGKSEEELKKMIKETDNKYLNLETVYKTERQLHEDENKTHTREKADLNEELFQSKQKVTSLEERHSKLFGRYNTQFQECKELKYELDRLKKTSSETQQEDGLRKSPPTRAEQKMLRTTGSQTDVDKSKMGDSLHREVSKIVKEFEERIPLSKKEDEMCSFKGKQLHGVVADIMKMIRSQWNTLLQNTDNFDVKQHIDTVFDRYATSVLQQTEEILSSLKSKELVSHDFNSLRDEMTSEKMKNTKLEKEKNRMEKSLSDVQNRCIMIENELKKYEQDIVKLTKEKSEILQCNMELKQEIESKHRKITDTETNLKSYMRNISDYKVKLDEMKRKNKVTEGKLEEKDNEISHLKSTISSGKQRYSMLKEQMDTMQKLQKKKKERISKQITLDDDSGKIWIHFLNFLKKLHILPFVFQKVLNVHPKSNCCFYHQTN